VSTVSRLDKITCLFCRISPFSYTSFAKETYNFTIFRKAPWGCTLGAGGMRKYCIYEYIVLYMKLLWGYTTGAGSGISKYIYIVYIWIHKYIYRDTGWCKLMGCLELHVIFRKRATNYSALLRKMTYKDKASYGSSPPCTRGLYTWRCSDAFIYTYICI